MKKALLIYQIMSFIMLGICITLALYSMTNEPNWIISIIPILSILLFAVFNFILKNRKKIYQKLINNIYNSHILVVFAVVEAVVVFKLGLATSIIITFITILMMTAMVMFLRYTFGKLGVSDAEN